MDFGAVGLGFAFGIGAEWPDFLPEAPPTSDGMESPPHDQNKPVEVER